MLTGNDLIALGLRPGKYFKDALAHINAHDLEGEALEAYVAPFRAPAPLPVTGRVFVAGLVHSGSSA